MRLLLLVVLAALAGFSGGHKDASDYSPEALAFFEKQYVNCRDAIISNSIADKTVLMLTECQSDSFIALGYYERAFTEANAALSENPEMATALLNRAVAYNVKHDWDASFADVDKVIGLADLTASERAIAHYIRAEYSRNLGELKRAIEEASKAIQLDDSVTYAYLLRGRVLNEQLRASEAAKDFDVAYKLAPQDTVVLLARSRFRSSNRQFTGAMSDLDTAIALEPKNHYLYFQRAKVWAQMGNRKRAREDFDKANELAAAE
jgi:tetratricopeptide (TPR) repeat protein